MDPNEIFKQLDPKLFKSITIGVDLKNGKTLVGIHESGWVSLQLMVQGMIFLIQLSLKEGHKPAEIEAIIKDHLAKSLASNNNIIKEEQKGGALKK